MSDDQNRGYKNQASQMDIEYASAAVPDAFSSVCQSAVLCQLLAHSLQDRYCSADEYEELLHSLRFRNSEALPPTADRSIPLEYQDAILHQNLHEKTIYSNF